ncbi:MAG TPA: VOC family protein [Blastocatellia bacterium]|nr:VOC family protein [Blastocatellia bacterium]
MREESHCEPGQLRSISPLFVVDDVEESAEYYRDKLGFDFEGYWGYPPRLTSVLRDGVEIVLKSGEGEEQQADLYHNPKRKRRQRAVCDAYISVADLDALYSELRSRKAKIVRKPETTEYATREFAVEDCNGYIICFAQSVEDQTG